MKNMIFSLMMILLNIFNFVLYYITYNKGHAHILWWFGLFLATVGFSIGVSELIKSFPKNKN